MKTEERHLKEQRKITRKIVKLTAERDATTKHLTKLNLKIAALMNKSKGIENI